ncbi:MAG: phosphoribosyl-ATP diphosphatase [Peptococcaceae bacterium]|nr:phosphoribosyl-ATP diphosphatase [Peptococcaceae bacterium]
MAEGGGDRYRILDELCRLIGERRETVPAGSYTAYLFRQGEDKILKKVGEEAAEVIIAAKNGGGRELAREAADLVFHLLVLLNLKGLALDDVLGELRERREKQAGGDGAADSRRR